MSKYTKCSSCGKEILFVPMLDSGKMMPIDAESIQKYIVEFLIGKPAQIQTDIEKTIKEKKNDHEYTNI